MFPEGADGSVPVLGSGMGGGTTGSCEGVCPSLWEAQVRSCPAAPVTGLSDGLSCLLSDHQ